MATIICLANSYKHGDRCIAGIELRSGKWVRPVSNTEDRAITRDVRLIRGNEPRPRDVLEIPLGDCGPDEGCQPENVLLQPGPWTKLDRVTEYFLLRYCQDSKIILHNHDNHVAPEHFKAIPKTQWQSLQLVRITNVSFSTDHRGKWRAHFEDGKGFPLALKVTDPIILDKLCNDESVGTDCILTISLAAPWKPKDTDQPELCYKMVAGVIEL